jgi:hypothetical protein
LLKPAAFSGRLRSGFQKPAAPRSGRGGMAGFAVGAATLLVFPFLFMKMKILRHCYLLVALLFTAGLGSARAQSFAWARIVRGAVDTTTVRPQASATDAAGNTYVAVSYKDSLRIGGILFTSSRNQFTVVIKYDGMGAVVWAKGLTYLYVLSMAADNSAGGVFLTGNTYANGVPTWGGTTVPVGLNAVYHAKCSTTGTLQWANTLPINSGFGGRSTVVADDAGNAYVIGTVGANTSIGGVSVTSRDNYVLKTDGTGTTQWVRVLHTDSLYPLYPVLGRKPGGGCLLGGTIYNTPLYLGAGTGTTLLPGRALSDGFMTSFDAAGNHQWTQQLGSTASATVQGLVNPYSLAADASGNCYVTGVSSGTVQMGGNTLVNGFLLAKYNAAGTLLWVRDSQTANVSSGSGLVVGTTGPTVMISTFTTPLTVGTIALRATYNYVHFNDQGVAQWATADAWPVASASYFSPAGLGIDAQDNLYVLGQPRNPFTNFPVFLLGAQTTIGKGVILSRLNAYANTLRGQVYLDQNGNGQQDATEGVFPRQLNGVLTQGSSAIYSPVDSYGGLQVYASPGAYTLNIPSLPTHYTLTQPTIGAYTGTFSGSNQLLSGQSFGIAPVANQSDVRVTLTPYATSRPGFTNRYRLTVENAGTTTVPGGSATLALDSHFTYVSSTPSATRTGTTLTWTYGSLAPFGRADYDVLLSLPTNAVLGTALSSTASAPLTGDVEPTDNTSTLAQTIVGSYDPNSMEVNYERITPTQVAAQQWLEYTIHFQNLGTASAINIILSDTLDFQKLNPASIQWITQSHNCSWSLSSIGPNTGLLTVRFLGINLPERNVDVIRSQGFVRFRVRARPTLAVGEVIPNHAGIVFDYNEAVITNVATTTVFVTTAALGRHDAPAWTAYPNPATDVVTLSADLVAAGPVRVELLDVLGRPVRQQRFTAPAGPLHQALNLQGLAAGVYVLRLTPPTGPATSRQVVLN